MHPPLVALVYVSTASGRMPPETWNRLLAGAREHNRLNGISGVLLYSDGNFMQYLEGPRPAVEETFLRIQQDPRHHSVIKLFCKDITAPEFAAWPVAYWTPDEAPTASLGNTPPFQPEVEFEKSPQSGPRVLLHGFWQRIAAHEQAYSLSAVGVAAAGRQRPVSH